MRFGIRQKLFIAIGAIAGLTLVSSLVAWIFFTQLRGTLNLMAERSIPAMNAALSLAAQSAELAAAAPVLAYAASQNERQSAGSTLSGRVMQLDRLLAEVNASDASDAVKQALERDVSKLSATILAIDEAVNGRLKLTVERAALTKQLTEQHTSFLALSRPAVDQSVMDMTMEFELASRGKPEQIPDKIQEIMDGQLNAARAMMELVAKVNQAVGMLAVASQAGAAEEIELIASEFVNVSAEAARAVETALVGRETSEEAKTVAAILALGRGENSLFKLRGRELAALDKAVLALAEARKAAETLRDSVEQLVQAARDGADSASRRSLGAITLAQSVQGMLALGSLLAAALIAWLFVGRRVVDPITSTTAVMGRLAARDWATPVAGIERSDEIGAMARAVQVFKEQGQEADRLQSRIEADRQRYEAERREQEALLRQAVGEIVAAAAAGNLERRIDIAALDGVMRDLGGGVNDLLATLARVLHDLDTALHALADGDLTRRIDGSYDGVFGQLAGNANQVAERLAGTLRQLNETAGNVRDAAQEISVGAHDLAQRTEAQSASLQRTAAAMEQVTATVRQNADNARAANQQVAAARDTADQGGQVTREAVAAMGGIEDSARRISDIVTLIDEIAFQTNLLALNASVEAARAGEAGKGFAVVAQEVRGLAQRSADASKDIKALISESNNQVRRGVGLVNQTGQALDGIVAAVKKVADLVSDIVTASQEQTSGLDAINDQVAQMDEMTQRNGALVEETTASTQALADQAKELARLVGYFRVTR
ncbi:methyl-accepting chemotaxis protein [Ferrovibrio sp.]|uniref:methyl-accepting chemotaxis protein n=1 Tax=Ferrovibrio sp. TaxID=1917215 RepID=UPI001B6C09FC|nr:methyl-accepting chemotaxis protein [Ferrovibrio sp.]MBP7062646.1 HAMP domain-containing protein [Ferrovibrio sp.]